MSFSFRRLGALALADGLERSRRPAFLVTLGVGLWAAWLFSPPNRSVYSTLQIGEHRGIYNSAWLGSATALLTSLFFSIAGFYIVKNAIAGDRATGVGPVLAATPMRNVEYTLGKWLASTSILGAMMLVILAGAAGMQIARGEDPHVRPLVLAAPFLIGTLPALALAAAFAVLFEAIPGLRGGAGNLVWFFLWTAGLGIVTSRNMATASIWDPFGLQALLGEMLRACMERFPDVRAHPERLSVGLNFRSEGVYDFDTFVWEGPRWRPALVLPRLAWLAAAAGIAALAALPFDRFAGERAEQGARARRGGGARERTEAGALELPAAGPPAGGFRAESLPAAASGSPGLTLALAEWRLLTAGASWGWWLTWLLLQIPGTFAPRELAARFAAVAWIWPVLLWSALGARDRVHGTAALLDSSPRPVARQLPAAWAAGAMLGLIAGAGHGVRAVVAGDGGAIAGWFAGAAFVPALALALGTLTGGRKTFEVVFVVLWYMGPLNGVPFLDFIGGSGAGAASGFAAAAAMLLTAAGAARIGRRRAA